MDSHDEKARAEKTERIRHLNDRLRTCQEGGRFLVTAGVNALPIATLARVIVAIRKFDDFSAANDCYGEHDFGRVIVDEHEVFWKIDYYGIDWDSGSPDASDNAVTARVLTIMLASEF